MHSKSMSMSFVFSANFFGLLNGGQDVLHPVDSC